MKSWFPRKLEEMYVLKKKPNKQPNKISRFNYIQYFASIIFPKCLKSLWIKQDCATRYLIYRNELPLVQRKWKNVIWLFSSRDKNIEVLSSASVLFSNSVMFVQQRSHSFCSFCLYCEIFFLLSLFYLTCFLQVLQQQPLVLERIVPVTVWTL